MGRPLKHIDQKQFENLCGLQCTLEEICDFFNVTDKTLDSWCKRTYKAGFSEVFKQKRGKGKYPSEGHNFGWPKKMPIWQSGWASNTWDRGTSRRSIST